MADRDEELRNLLGDDYELFQLATKVKWVGPFKVGDMLENCLNDDFPKPPESNSVYLVSKEVWGSKLPMKDCAPLYVGSNTSKSPRFCSRIGDLIADMFGFFYHHSGGQSIHSYCKAENLSPLKLYVGWLERCGCNACAEHYFWETLRPELNIKAPPKCQQHKGKDRYLAVIPSD